MLRSCRTNPFGSTRLLYVSVVSFLALATFTCVMPANAQESEQETAAAETGPNAPAVKSKTASAAEDAKAEDTEPSREQRLAEYLSNSQFVGKFTVDGKDGDPKTETYTIKSCKKLESQDLYRFVAHIKYGNVDQEVPLDLKILWAGNTPIITLDSLWIPGMGTFDARVMIRRGRYAGTWQHGENGGHLFGKIVKQNR